MARNTRIDKDRHVMIDEVTIRKSHISMGFIIFATTIIVALVVVIWWMETTNSSSSNNDSVNTTSTSSITLNSISCKAPTEIDDSTIVPATPLISTPMLVCQDQNNVHVVNLYTTGKTVRFTGKQLIKMGLNLGQISNFRFANPSNEMIFRVSIWNCAQPDWDKTDPDFIFNTLTTDLINVPWDEASNGYGFIGCSCEIKLLNDYNFVNVFLDDTVQVRLPVGSYSGSYLARIYKFQTNGAKVWSGLVYGVQVPFQYSEPLFEVLVYPGTIVTTQSSSNNGLFPAVASYPTYNVRKFYDDKLFLMHDTFPTLDLDGIVIPYRMTIGITPFRVAL